MNNSVAVFILALLLTSVLFALVSGDDGCDGFFNSTFTKLNFSNANVVTNELHLNGNLTYGGIGVAANKSIDMVFTETEGNYSDIADVWINEKDLLANESKNGLNGKFGKINLQNVPGKPKSGEGNFQACMVASGTNDPVVVEKFSFSVFDFDNRGDDLTKTENGQEYTQYALTEMLVIDTSQAQSIQLDPNFSNGIEIDCEDDGVTPIGNSNSCSSGRTIYRAKEKAVKGDNPDDPNNLTSTQLERSVVVNFVNTSCFNFTFNVYCPVDEGYELEGEANNSPPDRCRDKIQGGNLNFAGRSEQIIQNGTCITRSPTDMPSDQPSVSPSQLPSKRPSTIPSTSPSNEPSQLPSKLPSTIPSTSPSNEPSQLPSKLPSTIPSTSPSKEPSQLPSKAPSKAPSDIPSSSPSESQCPLDISLYSIDGNTPVNLLDAIRILDQNTTHVTVRLFQVWDAEGTVENIYFTYRNGPFKEICDEGTNVNGTDVDEPSFYKDFTIKCYSTRPVTLIGLCVADSGGALNSTLDNATIPANCCGGISQSTPAVCYKVVIQCDTLCVDAAALRIDCPAEARTETPTQSPTKAPTETPTQSPTEAPTETPTQSPTEAPTETPTQSPTEAPTETPTKSPTKAPTETPTQSPTEAPTETPTQSPTGEGCCSDNYKTCRSQYSDYCWIQSNCEGSCGGVWLPNGPVTGCLARWATCEEITQWWPAIVRTVQGDCCPGMACTGGSPWNRNKRCAPTSRRLADDNTGTEDEEDLEATFPDAPKTPQVLETIE